MRKGFVRNLKLRIDGIRGGKREWGGGKNRMDQTFYESAEEIVKAYKSGELGDNYPMLVEAIKILLREVLEEGRRFEE